MNTTPSGKVTRVGALAIRTMSAQIPVAPSRTVLTKSVADCARAGRRWPVSADLSIASQWYFVGYGMVILSEGGGVLG
jgi:hypothetical protein